MSVHVGVGSKMFKGVIIPVISLPFIWIEGTQVKRECRVSFFVIVMALQHSFSLGNSCGSTCTASVLLNNTNAIHVPVISSSSMFCYLRFGAEYVFHCVNCIFHLMARIPSLVRGAYLYKMIIYIWSEPSFFRATIVFYLRLPFRQI